MNENKLTQLCPAHSIFSDTVTAKSDSTQQEAAQPAAGAFRVVHLHVPAPFHAAMASGAKE